MMYVWQPVCPDCLPSSQKNLFLSAHETCCHHQELNCLSTDGRYDGALVRAPHIHARGMYGSVRVGYAYPGMTGAYLLKADAVINNSFQFLDRHMERCLQRIERFRRLIVG